MAKPTKMVIGCGYLGHRVAARWKQNGDRVLVGTRRAERAKVLASEGYEVVVLDVSQPDTLEKLPSLDTLLFAVAYDPQGNASRQAVTVGGLQNVLNALDSLSNRLIYISTTGVYGQRDHPWVNEESRCEPQRAGGRCYLAAEQLLKNHRWAARSIVLRLGGIYGPGRVPYLGHLRAGRPVPVDVDGYLNLIHVDDAVRVIQACEQSPLPNRLIVSDGSPVRRGDYYREVAKYVGCVPTFCPPEPTSPHARRGLSSKRVSNRKLIRDLAVQLQYPSYREGLASIFEAARS